MSSYRGKALGSHGWECAECGAESGIEVHHIDGDRHNNDVDNLLPLCDGCHKQVHRGDHPVLSERVQSQEERGYIYYNFSVPDDGWAEWKDTVPRSERLDERLIELIEADTEGRVSEER